MQGNDGLCKPLKLCDVFKYLGGQISYAANLDKEIKKRLRLMHQQAYDKYKAESTILSEQTCVSVAEIATIQYHCHTQCPLWLRLMGL